MSNHVALVSLNKVVKALCWQLRIESPTEFARPALGSMNGTCTIAEAALRSKHAPQSVVVQSFVDGESMLLILQPLAAAL